MRGFFEVPGSLVEDVLDSAHASFEVKPRIPVWWKEGGLSKDEPCRFFVGDLSSSKLERKEVSFMGHLDQDDFEFFQGECNAPSTFF